MLPRAPTPLGLSRPILGGPRKHRGLLVAGVFLEREIPTNSSNRSPLQEVPRVPLVKISLHVPGHFGPNVKGRCPDQDIGSDLRFDDEAPLPTVSAACLPFVTLNPNT